MLKSERYHVIMRKNKIMKKNGRTRNRTSARHVKTRKLTICAITKTPFFLDGRTHTQRKIICCIFLNNYLNSTRKKNKKLHPLYVVNNYSDSGFRY